MLTPDDYAMGRRVKTPDGRNYDVLDHLITATGNRFLVVSDPEGGGKNGLATLVPEGTVRDGWEARDPEEVQGERENEQGNSQATESDSPSVTDVPGVTGPPADVSQTGAAATQEGQANSGSDADPAPQTNA